MMVQCRVCKRIRDNGQYRLPWPGELSAQVSETYCPRCARETLRRIQDGEFARLAVANAERQAELNRKVM